VLRDRLEAFVYPKNRLTRLELAFNREGADVFEELAALVTEVSAG
jgi:hypothetical protein